MTVITPPLYLNVDSEYGAADLGLPYRDLIAEGVVGSSALAVSQRGAGANMSVDVAAGVVWIKGDDSDLQPCYRCVNDGTVNLAIAAADGTNPRIDRVVAEVRDAVFSGVSTDWRLRVITGTPAGSPSAPSTPDNAVSLATVSVPAGDTTIGTSQITDTRPLGGLQGGLGVPLVTSLPAAPYDGQVVDYLADSSAGVVWRFRYRAAASGSYKWEFVGGPPMSATVATQQSTTSATFTDLATAGPTVTTPLAGDYFLRYGARMNNSGGGNFSLAAPRMGGTAAVDADSILMSIPSGAHEISMAMEKVKTAVPASTAIKLQYRTSGGTASASERFLFVTPIRVG